MRADEMRDPGQGDGMKDVKPGPGSLNRAGSMIKPRESLPILGERDART